VKKVGSKMDGTTISKLLEKITKLATIRKQPFIVLEHPNLEYFRALPIPEQIKYDRPLFNFMATIGNASYGFNSYSVDDLTEVYSSLRSQLAVEEALNHSTTHITSTSDSEQESAKST
jgi:hypothetical protein